MTKRILHVITNLSSGGAERMLHKLLAGSLEAPFEQAVLSLIGKEHIGEEIDRLGIRVETLGLSRGAIPSPKKCAPVWQLVRRFKPDLVQGWMYHGNLGAYCAAKAAPGRPVLAFNIRHTLYDMSLESPLSRRVIALGARVSARADAVLYNSSASAEQHEAVGYPKTKRHVIPNGFDLQRYRPNPEAKRSLRAELDLGGDAFVIGLIGRFHPMKDHKTFIQAARQFLKHAPNAAFVLAGRETTSENSVLMELLTEAGVERAFHLLGERTDIAEVIAGLDVLTNCSAWGEGFSNVIGEACACGVPCVVTDIGDALKILGDHGRSFPVADVESLVAQWKNLAELSEAERQSLGEKLRQRVIDRSSISAINNDYMGLYTRLLEQA